MSPPRTRNTKALQVIPDQRQRQREQILMALQAPNPDYNITINQAAATVRALNAFGITTDGLFINQVSATGNGAAANLPVSEVWEHLKTLGGDGIPSDVPLYFHAAHTGQLFELAPTYRELTKRPFTAQDFIEIFTDYGSIFATPQGALLNVAGIGQAINAMLQTVIDQAIGTSE